MAARNLALSRAVMFDPNPTLHSFRGTSKQIISAAYFLPLTCII